MSIQKAILIIVWTAILGTGLFIFYKKSVAIVFFKNNTVATSRTQIWETKINEQDNVTVSVTPVDLINTREWKFDIGMETHSVELDQDMTKVAVLVDDRGKEYVPVSWIGTEAGGHHREGVLIFKTSRLVSKYIELKIKNVGGSTERVFIWDM